MRNKLIVLTGPSGSGKTTIKNLIIKEYPNLIKPLKTCTTRPQRGEGDLDYNFLPLDTFLRYIENDSFIEHEEVYTGVFYGLLKRHVDRELSNANQIICVDVKGALKIKQIYGGNCISIFLNPKDYNEVVKRLNDRNADFNIEERLNKFSFEMRYKNKFDHSFDTAKTQDETFVEVENVLIEKIFKDIDPANLNIPNIYFGMGSSDTEHIKKRIKRGFDGTEGYDLNSCLIEFMTPRLQVFRDNYVNNFNTSEMIKDLEDIIMIFEKYLDGYYKGQQEDMELAFLKLGKIHPQLGW